MAPPLGAEIASGSVLTDYSIVPPLEFTRRELDSAYPLHDLHNGTFVSLDYDNEVYLVNLESGERQQITQDGLPKSEAVLSDQYIVWAAKGGEALDVYSQPYWLHHLFVHDRATGETRQITELPAQRRGLAIDGNLLVWSDDLKAREDITFEFDVYAYDLATSTEYPIGVVPGNQQEPDIYGSRVVWQEGERIYLYDLEAQAGRVLVENRWPKANPSIYGNRVVWEMTADVAGQPPSQSGPWSDLYMLDLDTGVMQLLTRTPVREENPELQDNRVLWVVRGGSCDVGELGPDGKPIPHSGGVYVLDLVTEETVKLTDYVEPRAWLDRDTIVIDEACMGGFFGYALQLSQH
jgi:beta propeller repeat protein